MANSALPTRPDRIARGEVEKETIRAVPAFTPGTQLTLAADSSLASMLSSSS